MRLSWFNSLSPISVAGAALALLLTATNAQSRDDSDRNDSDSSSASADDDRSGSRDSGDRSDQSDRSSQSDRSAGGTSSSRGAQAARQSGHPTLGVTFYSDQSGSLEIRRVMPGSPAEEAGLQRGDEILTVDGRRVASVQQLRQQIDRIGTNEEVEFGVLRDGQRRTVTATLTANQASASNQQLGSSQQQRSSAGNRNRQAWNQDQYGNSQGQGSHSAEYEQGYWAGYQRAQQELASSQGYGNRGQGYDSRGYQGNQGNRNQGYANEGNRNQGFANQGNRNQGYGNQGYTNQGYGQSYLRGSRGSENWQEDGNRASRGGNQAFLGVTLDESNRNAARVSNIYPNSPAEEAGLRPGDEIVSIDDEHVSSSRDLKRILAQKDTDDSVTIEVERNGRQRTLNATLVSQQDFLSSYNQDSYRMGRRQSYDQQQGSSSDSRSRRQQNQNSDEDQQNDNY
jgi:hypothetical protein